MARSGALLSSLLALLLVALASSFAAPKNTLAATHRSRIITIPPPSVVDVARPSSSPRRHASPRVYLNPNDDERDLEISSAGDVKFCTPLDRPLLAMVDSIGLVGFAAIGKSSHSDDGSVDLIAVLVTALPFLTAWLATSPLTGVYSPDDRENNVLLSTAIKVGKGWILAIPLGIALRGVIKGYVPPVPFIIVTLISTLVILAGARILFSVAEDFFVELVN